MKKLAFALGATLTALLPLSAPAAGLNELNANIAQLLQPFKNGRTEASLVVQKADLVKQRLVNVAAAASYRKQGEVPFSLQLKELRYTYGDGSKPTTKGSGSIGIDLGKVLGQNDLNSLIPMVEMLMAGALKNLVGHYGAAAKIDGGITDKNKDAAGNYVSMSGAISFTVDPAKLPANLRRDDIMLAKGFIGISLHINRGLSFEIELVSNPGYKGFRAEEKGLKEYLEALLKRDAKTLNELVTIFRQIDDGAEKLATGATQF